MGFKNYTKTAVIGLFVISAAASGCMVRGGGTPNQGNTPGIQRQGYTGQIRPKGIANYNTGLATPFPVPGQRMGITPGITQPSPTPGPTIPKDVGVPVPNSSPPPDSIQDGRQKAENIRKQLLTMQELRDANVIVVGNAALVAFTPQNPSTDADTMKNMVISRVKQIDTGITNVTCSQSADVMNQVGKLYNDMANHRPMNEVTNDFNQIIKNIAPASR